MHPKRFYLYSLLSGVLLSLAWYEWSTGFVLIIAFVPLLHIEHYYYENKATTSPLKILWYVYLSFLIWNFITNYWIYNATLFGAIAEILLNSLFSAIIFWFFHLTKRKFGEKIGTIALIAYWIGFEFIYLNGEISHPWLILGNGFANDIKYIQWYEYTGTLGGSLWILLLNMILFKVTLAFQKNDFKPIKKQLIFFVSLLLFPIFLSLILFFNYHETSKPYKTVVIQPNVDPYYEKFDRLTSEEQLNRILKLAAIKGDSSVDYFVAPETALTRDISENDIDSCDEVLKIKKFLTKYAKAKFVIGASTFRTLNLTEPVTPTARKYRDADMYYDCFNTALQIDTSGKIQIYHKSKLVVGVEKVPYPQLFKYISNLSINLGGASGSLGTQKHRSVLISPQDGNKIAPVVCYESIYGEYITEYIEKGAELIFIITNDGWWLNTSGFKQHFNFSRLRAIETRRDIASSANTGRSAFINQRGEAFQSTEWGKQDVIKGIVNANKKKTFYVRYGDFIGRLCAWTFLVLFCLTIFSSLFFKKEHH